MVIRSRRRAPASCTFTFNPTPAIVAAFFVREERKKKNTALWHSRSFLSAGREVNMNSSPEREEKPSEKLSHVSCFLSGALLLEESRF